MELKDLTLILSAQKSGAPYSAIAQRNSQTMAISVETEHAFLPERTQLTFRFVCLSSDGEFGSFKDFTSRGVGQYIPISESPVKGVRLDMKTLDVCKPYIRTAPLAIWLKESGNIAAIAKWVTDILTTEGFSITVDLEFVLLALISGEADSMIRTPAFIFAAPKSLKVTAALAPTLAIPGYAPGEDDEEDGYEAEDEEGEED